ncbi:TolC family protein [bacterium]|nr:TolC family protein [bacterium]
MKNILNKFIILSLVFMAMNQAYGSETLSFEDAYSLMMQNNKGLKAIMKSVEEKKYKRRAAVGHFLPTVGLNSTYAHLDDNQGFNIMGFSMDIQKQNLWYLGAGANWNIFTGGKILAYNSAARANFDGANQKLREKTNELTVELIKRYYGLRLAEDVVKVREQVLESVQGHLEDALKLEKAGIIARTERLHAEVALSEAERELKAAIRDKNVVEKSLYNLVQSRDKESGSDEFTAASDLFIYTGELKSQEEFLEATLKNNTSLKLLDVKKRLAKANFRSEVGNYSPTVSLFAYDIMASDDLTQLAPRWALGGTVNFTVFDGLSRYNNVRAAKALKEQTQYEIEDAKEGIELLVNKYYQELLKYQEQYESTDKSIERAQEALRVSKISFKEGLSTSLSVTDAQSALAGVKIARLSSVYNYDVTLAELLSLKGYAGEIIEYMKTSKTEKL